MKLDLSHIFTERRSPEAAAGRLNWSITEVAQIAIGVMVAGLLCCSILSLA